MEMKTKKSRMAKSRAEIKRVQASHRQRLKSTVSKEHAENTVGLTLGASSFVIEDDGVRSDS